MNFARQKGQAKTSFVKLLVRVLHPDDSEEFYCGAMDAQQFVDSKICSELSSGALIVSLDDLKNFRKAENEAFKAALSQPVRGFRAAYARTTCERIQKFILFATGNERQILKDATGNRRIIPIYTNLAAYECPLFEFFDRHYVRQLWGEAVDWRLRNYKDPGSLSLSKEAQELLEKASEEAFVSDPYGKTTLNPT